MKRKIILALCLALVLTIFSNVALVFAQDPELKPFTLTKKVGGAEEKVGDYDKFYDAVNSMDINDKTTFYTIYVNKDATIPEGEMGGSHRSNSKFRLTSGNGGPFTLKREGEWGLLAIQEDSELTVDNITLDGNGTCQCFFISNNGKVTIGDNAIIQNFVDSAKEDGPAIYMTGEGTLNILPGAVLQNNKGNDQGGAICANNGTAININGGSFINNKSGKYGGVLISFGDVNISGGTFKNNSAPEGGVIAAYKTLNITGGTFENNSATKSGGAIRLGSKAKASISNATFEKNEAKWGGAVFTSNGIKLDNVKFIENTAAKQGGGIYISKGDSQITDCSFTKNGSQAIFVNHNSNGTTTISKTSFTENYSNSFGAGIYLGINSKLVVNESTFTKNEAAYGAGIASAGSTNFDDSLTNIKIDNSTFTENEGLQGAGISTAFPTEINNSTFTKNKAHVHPQDNKSNPHVSGMGGAIYVRDSGIVIKGSNFEENWSYGSGGAIGINGVERDSNGNIVEIKENLKVNISDNTKFKKNISQNGQGGAIYTIPYQYMDPINLETPKNEWEKKAYKNLTISSDTVFESNFAELGYSNPPQNWADFSNLGFKTNSFTNNENIEEILCKSLLNNYDVNYRNEPVEIIYSGNGGIFTIDGKEETKKVDIYPIDLTSDVNPAVEITITDSVPTREGYNFKGWLGEDGQLYQKGMKIKVGGNKIFTAQWESKKPEPKPEPKPQPKDEGQIIFFGKPKQEPAQIEETHIAYINGYPDDTVRPEGKITRAEAVTMVVRLKAYPMIEGAGIYKDVAKDAWYAPYVEAAYRQGILEEKAGEAFRPDENITRGELAQLISHIDKKNDAKAPFTDVEGYKYKAAIDQSYGNARILGYPDNTFRPDAEITRAETAAMLNRLFERSVRREGIMNIEVKIFLDLQDTNYWAYYEIIEAANTHTYVRIRPNTVEELWKTVIK